MHRLPTKAPLFGGVFFFFFLVHLWYPPSPPTRPPFTMRAAVFSVLACNVSLFRKTRYHRYPFSHDNRTAVIHYLLSNGWFGRSPRMATRHLFSIWYKKKNQPWPFMFHLHLWYMSNLSKTSKDSCETNRASQTTPTSTSPHLFIVRMLYIFLFSTVLSYCRHSDRWGALVLNCRAPYALILPRWSNTPFVWFPHKVCRCLHHLYVAARCSYVWRRKDLLFPYDEQQCLAEEGKQSPLCFYQCLIIASLESIQ